MQYCLQLPVFIDSSRMAYLFLPVFYVSTSDRRSGMLKTDNRLNYAPEFSSYLTETIVSVMKTIQLPLPVIWLRPLPSR